jgi:hypothetical protein
VRGGRLVGTVATVAGVAVLVRLSVWQWQRGSSRGSLLSYTYAVEWMLLALGLVVAVAQRRRRGPHPPDEAASRDAAGRLIGPPLRPGEQLGAPTGVQVRRWLIRGR